VVDQNYAGSIILSRAGSYQSAPGALCQAVHHVYPASDYGDMTYDHTDSLCGMHILL